MPSPGTARLALAGLVLAASFSSSPRPAAASSLVLLQGYPTLQQQHSLTCESSAASMGTRGVIGEGRLMAVIPRDPNPNLGFRGNPDGSQGTSLVDYGVYAAPLQRALAHYGYHSELISYGSDRNIKSYIRKGWPVVIWVTFQLQPAVPRLQSFAGVQFFLVPHEHAVLAVGFGGGTILANDPATGKEVRYYWSSLDRAWGYFGNMALAIEPCPAPLPVSSIGVLPVTSSQLTFTWVPGRHDAGYVVMIVRHGKRDVVVFHGTLTSSQATITNPRPGVAYEIDVQGISTCNGAAATRRLWVSIPTVLPGSPTPTPTPRATSESTVAVTPTDTITPTPTDTSTATVTATATDTTIPTATTTPTSTDTPTATVPPTATLTPHATSTPKR
jgi:uncharacterized protein YvpB